MFSIWSLFPKDSKTSIEYDSGTTNFSKFQVKRVYPVHPLNWTNSDTNELTYRVHKKH